MKIVLHLGVHRTGTASLAAQLSASEAALAEIGVAYWGAASSAFFAGLGPRSVHLSQNRAAQRQAEARAQDALRAAKRAGQETVLISDPAMLGSLSENLWQGELYPSVGQRMRYYWRALGGQVSHVVVTLRPQDSFWQSALAAAVLAGHPVPNTRLRRAFTETMRSWRHVVTDLAAAMPGARICVCRHPGTVSSLLTAFGMRDLPPMAPMPHLNKAPDLATLRAALVARGQDPVQLPQGEGPWQALTHDETAILREHWADDLMWLSAGADGLATLTDETQAQGEGTAHPAPPTGGHEDGRQERLDKAG